MKHHSFIALVFIVGCATGGVAAQLVVPSVRAGTSPTRWEYECIYASTYRDGDGGVTSTLNEYGTQGWEFVTMAPSGTTFSGYNKYVICAKRPLP